MFDSRWSEEQTTCVLSFCPLQCGTTLIADFPIIRLRVLFAVVIYTLQ